MKFWMFFLLMLSSPGLFAQDSGDIDRDLERLKLEIDQDQGDGFRVNEDHKMSRNPLDVADDEFTLLKLKGQNSARLKQLMNKKNKAQKANQGKGNGKGNGGGGGNGNGNGHGKGKP